MTGRGSFTARCVGCGAPLEVRSRQLVESGTYCSAAACLSAYNAQAKAALRAARVRAAATRRARAARVPVVAGDWGLAVLLSNPGLSDPGVGR